MRGRSAAVSVVLVAVLGIVMPACSLGRTPVVVRVLGPWTDTERAQFQDLLDEFERVYEAETSVPVEVREDGTRALSQVLAAEVDKGEPHDVVLLPTPGDLPQYVGRGLVPLDDILDAEREHYSETLTGIGQIGDRRYAAPVEANLKSLVWYRPSVAGVPRPAGWNDLVAMSRAVTGRGMTSWCLGMGAAATSGWPGSDWIEDLLLHTHGPDVYQQWARGELPWDSEPVRTAWQRWGELVAGSTPAGRDPAPTRARALLTDFRDVHRGMFDPSEPCAFEHQASFALAGYRAAAPPGDIDIFPFPDLAELRGDAAASGPRPVRWAVAADVAVLFNATDPARALIRYLASERAQRLWPGRRRPSAHRAVTADAYPDELLARISVPLTGHDEMCFDGSDAMPPAMRAAFYRAVLDHLSNPDDLDAILDRLEEVRTALRQDDTVWLPRACGR